MRAVPGRYVLADVLTLTSLSGGGREAVQLPEEEGNPYSGLASIMLAESGGTIGYRSSAPESVPAEALEAMAEAEEAEAELRAEEGKPLSYSRAWGRADSGRVAPK